MLVFFALSLTVLMGFCGLAVDIGRIELRKTQLQAAADAGVLSSTAELRLVNPLWQGVAVSEVAAMASANGYPAPNVAVQIGADYGSYVGDLTTVEITLTQQVPTYFLGIVSSSNKNASLKVQAVAQQTGLGPVALVQ